MMHSLQFLLPLEVLKELFVVKSIFYVLLIMLAQRYSVAVIKLLSCDHEVIGSYPGNSLLQKCRERPHT
jgi:hypothetical protein